MSWGVWWDIKAVRRILNLNTEGVFVRKGLYPLNIRLGVFINVAKDFVFIVVAVLIIITVDHNMCQQALVEAQSKIRIILDRNLATYIYFTNILKTRIFAWIEPYPDKGLF